MELKRNTAYNCSACESEDCCGCGSSAYKAGQRDTLQQVVEWGNETCAIHVHYDRWPYQKWECRECRQELKLLAEEPEEPSIGEVDLTPTEEARNKHLAELSKRNLDEAVRQVGSGEVKMAKKPPDYLAISRANNQRFGTHPETDLPVADINDYRLLPLLKQAALRESIFMLIIKPPCKRCSFWDIYEHDCIILSLSDSSQKCPLMDSIEATLKGDAK